MELNDLAAARLKFLWIMHNIRKLGDTWPIFYLDEMYVKQSHMVKYVWQDLSRYGGL